MGPGGSGGGGVGGRAGGGLVYGRCRHITIT